MEIFSVVDEFIKRRDEFFKNLAEEKNLEKYFVNSSLTILVFSAIYGATMGIYSGGLQIVYSAIKVPILLLISLYITVPSYHVIYSLLGGRRTLGQTVILLLFSFTIMSTFLIAMVPVNFFFIITTAKSFSTYAFTVLMNITIFTLGGFFALTYFIKGAKTLYREPSENWKPAFLIGSTILMFVGTQFAWVLRPYFRYHLYFIRPLENNFYTAVTELIVRYTGSAGIVLIIVGIIVIGLLYFSALTSPKEAPQTYPHGEIAPTTG